MLQVTNGWPAWPTTIFSCFIWQRRPIFLSKVSWPWWMPDTSDTHIQVTAVAVWAMQEAHLQRLHEPKWGWSACSGLSAGQSAGCLHDHRWLVSGSVSRSSLESSHWEATGWNSEPTPAQTHWSSWAVKVPVEMQPPQTEAGHSVQESPIKGVQRGPILAGLASCT